MMFAKLPCCLAATLIFIVDVFIVFLEETTPGDIQDLLLGLCSKITPDGVQGTICDAGAQT